MIIKNTSLEYMLAHLDQNHPFKQKYEGYIRECKTNLVLETKCILACEIGEFFVETGAYFTSLPHINEIGAIGGTAAGFWYAIDHILKHGKKHKKNASVADAAGYAASTEFGCVASATVTEYIAGKFSSIPNNPLSIPNMGMRVGSLPAALILGLIVMSGFTYRKQNEAGRFIAANNALPFIHEILNE